MRPLVDRPRLGVLALVAVALLTGAGCGSLAAERLTPRHLRLVVPVIVALNMTDTLEAHPFVQIQVEEILSHAQPELERPAVGALEPHVGGEDLAHRARLRARVVIALDATVVVRGDDLDHAVVVEIAGYQAVDRVPRVGRPTVGPARVAIVPEHVPT